MTQAEIEQELKRCFGKDDGLFASHPTFEGGRAGELLAKILESGNTWPDLETAAESFMANKGFTKELIATNRKRLRNLEEWLPHM